MWFVDLLSKNILTKIAFFGSILPISLQQIASEKSHTVHPNKLEKRYTLIPMTIHIVKYLGGDIVKLFDFSRLVFFSKIALQPSVKLL